MAEITTDNHGIATIGGLPQQLRADLTHRHPIEFGVDIGPDRQIRVSDRIVGRLVAASQADIVRLRDLVGAMHRMNLRLTDGTLVTVNGLTDSFEAIPNIAGTECAAGSYTVKAQIRVYRPS